MPSLDPHFSTQKLLPRHPSNLPIFIPPITNLGYGTLPLPSLSQKCAYCNNRLQDRRTSVTVDELSQRAAYLLHDVLYGTFRCFILCDGNVSVQDRRPCLGPAEEQMIVDAALDFARIGTPLSRECLKDVMQHFIRRLSFLYSDAQNSPFANAARVTDT